MILCNYYQKTKWYILKLIAGVQQVGDGGGGEPVGRRGRAPRWGGGRASPWSTPRCWGRRSPAPLSHGPPKHIFEIIDSTTGYFMKKVLQLPVRTRDR